MYVNPVKSIFKRRGGWKVGLTLLLLYLTAAVGYSLLPWSVRRPVYERAPTVDRALQKGGFYLLQGLDELSLFGRDAKIPVDGVDRGEYVYGGYPSQGFQIFGRVTVLENRGYVVGYSDSMRNPLWVAYRLFDVDKLESGPRQSHFSIDQRTRAKVKHDDYTHTGFDRGHMAPNYGIATRYGAYAQKETFLMSNVIPQNPIINRHLWKDLEHRVANRYGRYFSEVWVVTGPVFQEPIEKLPSGIPIPSQYYKIIADERNGEIRVLAFLVEQRSPPYTRIKTCLVSVDVIEELTGLDFFRNLPAAQQADLESRPATRLWPWLLPAARYQFFGKTD